MLKCLRNTLGPLALAILLSGSVAAQQHPDGPVGLPYGGDHELGGLIGFSPIGSDIFGYDRNVRYAPFLLRYSYLALETKHLSVRYSPEVTLLSILHETSGAPYANVPGNHFGAGLSFEGFQFDFREGKKIQPFMSQDGGFVYFADRVLSPQGSQFMYTIDLGAGVNVFIRKRTAITFEYRYQHLSNADISEHNPGTDANTICIGMSHFHTHGVQ